MMAVTVIAEVGSVHDGSFGNAGELVRVAAECGADVVKFQTHIAAAETLRDAPSPPYFTGEPRFEYFERTSFSAAQLRALKAAAEARGIEFLSSPFSVEAVDLLEEVGVGRYKVPSGEVTNLPLIEAIADTGRPVLLSSGMSSWKDLDRAVETVRRRHDRLVVLQCTSAYPCPYERVGLNVMLEMGRRYGLPVGLSDHTLTPYAALAAVTLGATVVEKHMTLSRQMYGSDARHSLEPAELAEMIRGIRATATMLANPVDKDDVSPLAGMKAIFEKSVVSVGAIPRGTVVERGMLGFKKPGTGIPAHRWPEVVGRRAARDIPPDRLIADEDLEQPTGARNE
jgi:N,N'-diacetyllegionaminate synthase